MHDVKKFIWDEPHFFRICDYEIIYCCVSEVEIMSTLEVCHPSSVCWHHNGIQSAHKIMHCGYYWPTIYQYSHDFAMFCDGCKKQGGILKL